MARVLVRFIKKNSIYISNHDGYYDGAGAQTQRIFSIFGLASALELPFIFKPIEKVELQPIDFLTSEAELTAEVNFLNEWIIQFLGVQTDNNCARSIRITKSTQLPWKLFQLLVLGIFFRRNTALTFLDGYFAARISPQIWDELPALNQATRKNKPFDIHLHLRLTNFVNGDRAVGKDFFKTILDFVISELEGRGQRYKITIHTDFAGQTVNSKLLALHAVPESLRYWQSLGLIDDKLAINAEVLSQAKSYLKEIAYVFKETQIYVATHWVEEWESMASADLLIMGKSSFSAVGGLLNKNGLVVGPVFWNSGKPNWYTSDDISALKIWIAENL